LLVERLRARDRAFFTRLVPDRPDCIEEQFLVLVAHPRSYVDIEELSTGLESLPRRAFLDKCKRGLRYDYALAGEHINWFNHEKLLAMLSDCGFRHVARSLPQQSRFREMRGPRFDTRPDYSLHVDAVK
jgi:hypothetical protein